MASDDPTPITEWIDPPVGPIDDPFAPPAPTPRTPIRWRLGLALLAVSVLGTGLVIPFSIALLRQAKDSPFTPTMVPIIVIFSLVAEGVFSAATIALGLGLGRQAGLGPRMLDGADSETKPAPPASGGLEEILADDVAVAPDRSPRSGVAWGRVARTIGLATVLGVLLAVGLQGLSMMNLAVAKAPEGFKMPTPIESFLGSIGAGIREEVWLRLGAMTFLAWLATLVLQLPRERNAPAIWIGNILAALLFGAIHLPQAQMLFGLNVGIVAFVLVGNGVPGIVWGWLFWRRGLVAAMVSHAVFDVVLKVILPAILR